MKFSVSFKTPDTEAESIKQAVNDLDIADEETRHRVEMKCLELAQDYIQFGEFVTLEFDTDTASVHVKQCRKCLKQSTYAIEEWLKDHHDWSHIDNALVRTFSFPDFNSAMSFATRIGMWAERNDHHPKMEISWGKVKVSWSTDDVGGVTIHDLAGAAATNHFSARYYA